MKLNINQPYYMARACGRYNARSDCLRAISERSLCSRNAHGPITDYVTWEEPGSENASALKR